MPQERLPVTLGKLEDFEIVRNLMAKIPYAEGEVCKRLSLSDLDQLGGNIFKFISPDSVGDDLLGCFIKLFLLGETVEASSFIKLLSESQLSALRRLGLVSRRSDSQDFFSRVSVGPAQSVGPASEIFIVTDRSGLLTNGDLPSEDLVFSGHNPLTRQFLRLLKGLSGSSVLDLCCGSGVLGIATSSAAENVVASDIAARSCHFARFNVRLNECPNVDIRQGDLYETVKDCTFDQVVCHPPYVPTRRPIAVFRDGGPTGEELVRRVIRGVQSVLVENGIFVILGIGFDLNETRLEERVKGWLGYPDQKFDLIIAINEVKSAEDFARALVSRVSGSSFEDYEHWTATFSEMGLKQAVHGVIAGKRLSGSREPEIRRLQIDQVTSFGPFSELFGWFETLRALRQSKSRFQLRLKTSESWYLTVRKDYQDGRLAPSEFVLNSRGCPFQTRLKTEEWIADLIVSFEETRSLVDSYRMLRTNGILPSEITEGDFFELAILLLERGFLTLN